jgi:hypothetical protein
MNQDDNKLVQLKTTQQSIIGAEVGVNIIKL